MNINSDLQDGQPLKFIVHLLIEKPFFPHVFKILDQLYICCMAWKSQNQKESTDSKQFGECEQVAYNAILILKNKIQRTSFPPFLPSFLEIMMIMMAPMQIGFWQLWKAPLNFSNNPTVFIFLFVCLLLALHYKEPGWCSG